MTPAAVLDATARLVGAISIAFAGITVVKSRRAAIPQWAAWIARLDGRLAAVCRRAVARRR